MAENLESLVIEHFRHIRRSVDRIEADVGDLKICVTGLEAQIGNVQVQLAGQSARLDRLDGRVSRTERRPELSESHS